MRILLISGIFPPDIGGPASYVPKIARDLLERGHEVSVLTTAEPEHIVADTTYAFPVRRMNRRKPFGLRFCHYVSTIQKAAREADILFINGLFLETAIANLSTRQRSVIKVVGDPAWERAVNRGWTTQGFEEFQRVPSGLLARLSSMLRNWSVGRADQVIVPSEFLKRIVAGWGIPESRIRVIYNGITIPDKLPQNKITLPVQHTLITVCRLVPWKGVDELIRFTSQNVKLGLVIVGDGPEESRLRKLAEELNASERIYFAGRCSKEITAALMNNADLFLLNSRYEGLPHVALEARALGLPIIVTSAGGSAEAVKGYKAGRVVTPGDKQSLRQAVEELLGAGKPGTDFPDKFSANYMLTETRSFLESCASTQPSSS